MYDSIYDSIRSAKYASIFVLMALFPSETVMPLVGFAAGNGYVSLPWAILAGTAGSVFGSILIYGVARLVPQDTLDVGIVKYGRWLGLNTRNVEKAGRWFDKNAVRAVFFSRFVPGLRTAVTVPAGIRRMPFLVFCASNGLGTAACSALLAYLGYSARDRITEIHAIITSVSTFVYLCLLTLVLAYIFWRLQKRK